MTICMSCGRRTDPDRSFCTNCGSSVFVNSAEGAARLAPARTQRRPRNRPQSRTVTELPGWPQLVPIRFPFWSLIKLAFFFWILWKAAGLAMGVPEVRSFMDAAMRGESPAIAPAIDALRDRLQALIQDAGMTSSTPSTGDSVPTRRHRVPPPPLPPAVAMPDSTTAPTAIAPAAIGSAAPRVIRRVAAAYTEAAQREKIEGSVLLRAVVLSDGTVGDVIVVRSLDQKHGLDRQAVRALRQWMFEPARSHGEAVRTYVDVEISFRLR